MFRYIKKLEKKKKKNSPHPEMTSEVVLSRYLSHPPCPFQIKFGHSSSLSPSSLPQIYRFGAGSVGGGGEAGGSPRELQDGNNGAGKAGGVNVTFQLHFNFPAHFMSPLLIFHHKGAGLDGR